MSARFHLCRVSGDNLLAVTVVVFRHRDVNHSKHQLTVKPTYMEKSTVGPWARRSCAEVGKCQSKRVMRTGRIPSCVMRCTICEKTANRAPSRYPGQVCKDQSYCQGSFTIAGDDIPACFSLSYHHHVIQLIESSSVTSAS